MFLLSQADSVITEAEQRGNNMAVSVNVQILRALVAGTSVEEICSDWEVSPQIVRNIWDDYLISKEDDPATHRADALVKLALSLRKTA